MKLKKTYTETDKFLLKVIEHIYRHRVPAGTTPSKETFRLNITDQIILSGHFFQPLPFNFNTLVWIKKHIEQTQHNIIKENVYTSAMALCLSDSTNTINYYEGLVHCDRVTFAHAWCELEGRVVDINAAENSAGILGDFKRSSYYGVKISKSMVRENYLKQVELPQNDPKEGILNYLEETT